MNIQDFQGRLVNFVESQHIKIYSDQLVLAGQIWNGLSSEERQIPQVIEYITLGIFKELNQSTALENTKRMIRADVKVDETLIPQIKKMALLRGLDRWQSSGNIAEAKQRIIAAYEQNSVELNLADLDLSSLPAEIVQLRALKNLDLSYNNLTDLSIEIRQLRDLTNLNISFNWLKILPPEMGQLTALEFLNISVNYLTAMPPEISQLRGLKNLDFSNNLLTDLPTEMGQLTSLIDLDLSRNQLINLPPAIGQLRALTSLKLYKNRLTVLLPEIGQLRGLKNSNFSDNLLTDLPAEIRQLRALTGLDLSDNRLEVLPVEIGELKALTSLKLYNNRLAVLGSAIWQLTALTDLDLSFNWLKVLPPEIGQLTALIHLNLSGNQLMGLPHQIGQLTALMNLGFSRNRLTSLPVSIGRLINLATLVLHHNPLRELPLSLGQLHFLTYLDIDGTQLNGTFIQQLVAQCRAKREAEVSTLLLIKLVAWKAIGESDIDLSLFEPLTKNQKFDLFEWLVRLEKTRDFSNNQKNLAGVVCNMLQDVLRNKEFQELFFVQVRANNECCEDRAAMSFNEIFVSWKIICLSPNDTLKEKLLLLASAAKTGALRRFLDFAINDRRGQEGESVEIYLYYELLLKNDLKLLTAMREMRYGRIGQRDWINEQEIIHYVNNGYFTHLFDIPIFQKLFENDVTTKDEIKKIKEFYQTKLETLPPPINNAEQLLYPFHQGEIQEERRQALIKCANEWFWTVIGEQ